MKRSNVVDQQCNDNNGNDDGNAMLRRRRIIAIEGVDVPVSEAYFQSLESKLMSEHERMEEEGMSFKQFCELEHEREKQMLEHMQRYSTKWSRIRAYLEALLWTAVGVAIFHYSGFWNSLVGNDLAGGLFYKLFWASLVVMLFLFLYLIVYVKTILRKTDWLEGSDTAIFILAGTFLINGSSLLIAMWPIYGFKTPFIIGGISWGLFNALLLLPS